MKKRWRQIFVVFLAVLLIGLTACSNEETAETEAQTNETSAETSEEQAEEVSSETGNAEAENAATTEGYDLAIILGSAEMPFTQVLLQGVEANIRPEDNLSVYYCDWDANKAIQLVEDICANNVDAIMLDPPDPDAILPALQTAQDAGIPIRDLSSGSSDCLRVRMPEYRLFPMIAVQIILIIWQLRFHRMM